MTVGTGGNRVGTGRMVKRRAAVDLAGSTRVRSGRPLGDAAHGDGINGKFRILN